MGKTTFFKFSHLFFLLAIGALSIGSVREPIRLIAMDPGRDGVQTAENWGSAAYLSTSGTVICSAGSAWLVTIPIVSPSTYVPTRMAVSEIFGDKASSVNFVMKVNSSTILVVYSAGIERLIARCKFGPDGTLISVTTIEHLGELAGVPKISRHLDRVALFFPKEILILNVPTGAVEVVPLWFERFNIRAGDLRPDSTEAILYCIEDKVYGETFILHIDWAKKETISESTFSLGQCFFKFIDKSNLLMVGDLSDSRNPQI